MNPAIIVVAYNRPNSLNRLLVSIANANYIDKEINLIISIDKAKNESEVLKIAEQFEWIYGNKIIRTFKERQGLRKHIIQCGDLSNEYGAVIILEDDLIVSPGFYNYVKKAIEFYYNDDIVTGISLYSHEWNGYARRFFQPVADEYDTYLGQFSITWGQCWIDKWWNAFKSWYEQHEGKLEKNKNIPDNINQWSAQSWGRYFVNYIVENNKYYVIPRISLSSNFSEVGQHSTNSNTIHQVRILSTNKINYCFAPVNSAVKYDIYFENINISNILKNDIYPEGIDIDLMGIGRQNNDNRYVLTTKELPYKVIKTYALSLRPIDMNVLLNIPGNGIFLYDKYNKDIKPKNKHNVVCYEIRGISNREIAKYIIYVLFNKIKKVFLKNNEN